MRSTRSWLKEGTHQRDLEAVVTQLFGVDNIIKNARKVAPFWNNEKYEVDIWIPSLQLGFEFQDLYHFTSTWYSQRPLSVIKHVDKSKNEVVHGSNATLVSIPCWWDGSLDDLTATINFYRPDLFNDLKTPSRSIIPLNPPSDFFLLYSVPEIGEITLPSFTDSIAKFGQELSITNPWWLGEKYDGIRCIWSPNAMELHSRRGLTLQFPTEYLKQLPKVVVDGEIWCGRGLYMDTQKILANDFNWASFRIIAFDNPENTLKSKPFELRYKTLISGIPLTHPFTMFAPRMLCNNKHTMSIFVKVLIENGGEGAIMQKCKSIYEEGRTNSVVKLKTADRDSEALVLQVDHNTLLLKLPNGVQFEAEQVADIEVIEGDIVTFEHDNSSRGKEIPTNPNIIRVRRDLNWNDVISEYMQEANIKDYSTRPNKYWSSPEGMKELRKSLEDFAVSRNLSPLEAETWYSILPKEVSHIKGVNNQSYSSTVRGLFPEIEFDDTKFAVAPRGHLTDPKQRKSYFDNFAAQNNFDPLVAENWYNVQAHKFYEYKSGATILHLYYNGSFRKALVHLYPNVDWNPSRFLSGAYWGNFQNRKQFFDSFASENSFDPLVADNWYNVRLQHIYSKQNAVSVMQYYHGDLAKALPQVYPNIDFDLAKLSNTPNSHYAIEENRRFLFDTFAQENGFDPLVVDNWYTISSKQISSVKDMGIVLSFYHGKFSNALASIYPSLGIDKSRFESRIGYWTDLNNHKLFFDSFAQDNNFDPLVAKNWHEVKSSQIFARRGAASLLNYYQRNYAKALISIYPNIGLKIYDMAYCQDYSMWDDKEVRKSFFESFARDNNFDPLVNTNWYLVAHKFKQQILQRRHSKPLLKKYNGSANAALMDAFPNIGLLINLN